MWSDIEVWSITEPYFKRKIANNLHAIQIFMKVAASVLHSGYGELGEIYIPLIYIFVLKNLSA